MKSLVAVLLMTLGSLEAAGQEVRFQQVFQNLSFTTPIFMASVPDGSGDLVVVEKSGLIKRFSKDNPTGTRNYLDIRPKVQDSGEQGLLGFAFDPSFGENGYFYVYYIDRTFRRTNVSRFRDETGVANPESEKLLLTVDQPYSNHNGGMMAFGHDRMLYIALGDGGSGGDPHNYGQNLNSHLGKILRINPHGGDPYAVPADNPFVENPNAKPEIWAYGLRNPWRFSFDRLTGALWAGDVGQGSFEEVNLISRGDNLGWNLFEGPNRYRSGELPAGLRFRAPVHSYGRSDGNCITGGYVYRGASIKSQFGRYIFGDYGSGKIWSMNLQGQDVQQIGRLTSIGSFAEDSDGELYALSLRGPIYKMLPAQTSLRQSRNSWIPPAQISKTGFFKNLKTREAHESFESLNPRRAFWSDGLIKYRWIKIPSGSKIKFHEKQPWDFPVGTFLMKHFDTRVSETELKPIETRILWKDNFDWRSATYRWRQDGSDADILRSSLRVVIPNYNLETKTAGSQYWYFPAEGECFFCHNFPAGVVLGVNAHQFTEQKLVDWFEQGKIDRMPKSSELMTYPEMNDASASTESQARAYLDANCAYCHQPYGVAPGNIDFRFQAESSNMEIANVAPELGDLGIPGAKRLKPGHKEESILWERMERRGAYQMPPLGSDLIDQRGKELLGRWIDEME